MGAPTQYYVDPGAGGPGTGTIIDPWVSVQAAITAILAGPGRDAVNGDKINVKSDQAPGVAPTVEDVTVAALNLAGYVPAADAPLIVRGYSVIADDGGIGAMDGNNGGWSIYDGNAGATDYVSFQHMHLHNTGAANVVRVRDNSSILSCTVGTTAAIGIRTGIGNQVLGNWVYDCTNVGIYMNWADLVVGNFVHGATNFGIYTGIYANVCRNIVALTGNGTGIVIGANYNNIIGNSILATTGTSTGRGIYNAVAANVAAVVLDNLIEGFGGAGGDGIDFNTNTRHWVYGHNSFYGNTADETNKGDTDWEDENDLAMTASPFKKTGTLSFANRFAYFAPAIPVRGRAFPLGSQFDRGGAQVRLAVEREVAEKSIIVIPAHTVLDPL